MNTIKNLANIAENYNINNSNKLRDDIVSECETIFNSLDSVDKSIINKDISLLPIYKINEGLLNRIREKINHHNHSRKDTKHKSKSHYAIDLDSLKYVIESQKCTLKEAAQIIKNANNIEETCSLYCILPDNINEEITVQEFCNLVNYLNENNINIASTRDLDITKFINEAFVDDYVNIMNYKIKGNRSLRYNEKSINKLQKYLDKYEQELKEFKKMNKQEQQKYCKKINLKNILSDSVRAGLYAGYAPTKTHINNLENINPSKYETVVNKMINKLKSNINKLNSIIENKR